MHLLVETIEIECVIVFSIFSLSFFVLGRLYGINVCGEGGEYETLTLDCPLFTVSKPLFCSVTFKNAQVLSSHMLLPSCFGFTQFAGATIGLFVPVTTESKTHLLCEKNLSFPTKPVHA